MQYALGRFKCAICRQQFISFRAAVGKANFELLEGLDEYIC